ncbi:hypothetical protein GOODEAATRI_028000, partial [Goodea atripinnis]
VVAEDAVRSLPAQVALIGCCQVVNFCLPPALSAMIRGAADGERFLVRDYSEDELEKILEEFFSSLK